MGWASLVLAASLVWAEPPSRHARVLDALHKGDVAAAVRVVELTKLGYARRPEWLGDLIGATWEHLEKARGDKKKVYGPFVEKIREIGRLAAEQKTPNYVARAQCELFAARYQTQIGEDGLKTWHAAVTELADVAEGKDPVARMHAVGLLGELGTQPGALGKELAEQTMELSGTDESSPEFWAVRFVAWQHEIAGADRRLAKKSAKDLPKKLKKLRLLARTDSTAKEAHVALYNDVVAWCLREKRIRIRPEFVMDRRTLRSLSYSVPAGGRWVVSKSGIDVAQLDRSGRAIRFMKVFAFHSTDPAPGGRKRDPSPKQRAVLWAARVSRTGIKAKLRNGKVNKEFRKAAIWEGKGIDRYGRRRHLLQYEWNGLGGVYHFTLMVDEYEGADPKDAEYRAFLDSLTEQRPR